MAQMKPLACLLGALMAAPAGAWAQTPAMQPLDTQARNLMWSGHTNAATHTMREYVAQIGRAHV